MTLDPKQSSESEGDVIAAFAELADRRERTTNVGEAYKNVVVTKPKRRLVWPTIGATVLAAAAVAVAFGLANDDQTVEIGPATAPTTEVPIVEVIEPEPVQELPIDDEAVDEEPAPANTTPATTVAAEPIPADPPPTEEPVVEEEPLPSEVPAGFFATAEQAIAAQLGPSVEYRGDCQALTPGSDDAWCSTYSTVPLPGGLFDYDVYAVTDIDAFSTSGYTLQQQDGAWRVVGDHVHDIIYNDRDGNAYDISEPEANPQNLLVDIPDYWDFPVGWCDRLSRERIDVSCIDAEPGLFPDAPFGTWTVRLLRYDAAGAIVDEGTYPFIKNGDFYEYAGPG